MLQSTLLKLSTLAADRLLLPHGGCPQQLPSSLSQYQQNVKVQVKVVVIVQILQACRNNVCS